LRRAPLAFFLSLFVATACAHAPAAPREHADSLWIDDSAFTVRYEPGDLVAARQVKRALALAVPAAERWGELTVPVVITIHPDHESLETAVSRQGHSWLRGWARHATIDLQSPRTWTRGFATDAQMAVLLTHELTHCAMYQALGIDARAAGAIPLWFREGMASTTAGEARHAAVRLDLLTHLDPPGAMRHADGARTETALLYRSDPTPLYATADRAFRFLVGRHGEEPIRRVLQLMRDGEDFERAFEKGIGISVDEFERSFRSSLGISKTRG
jgi:hypothetical protein